MASIIGVQELQHTNGTSAATIDSTGRILTPARPSFFAYRTYGDQSDRNLTTITQVEFDATQHNVGGHYSTTTNKFVVPIDGIYHFSWQVRMANTTAAGYVYAALRKDDDTYWGSSGLYMYANLEDPEGGSYQTPNLSMTLDMTANEELDIVIVVSGDTTTRIQNALTFFSGFLVG